MSSHKSCLNKLSSAPVRWAKERSRPGDATLPEGIMSLACVVRVRQGLKLVSYG